MTGSLMQALLWAASAGVYVAAMFVVVRGAVPLQCRPNFGAALAALALFVADRAFPQYNIVFAPLLYVAVFFAIRQVFRTLKPRRRNDALFAVLYVEAIAPLLILVLADFFAAAAEFRDVGAWMYALPAPTTLAYLIVTRNQSVP